MFKVSKDGSEVNPPPYTDRGVEVSHNSIQRCVFSLDWLRLTVWATKDGVTPFLSLLGVDVGLENSGHGGTGFRSIWSGLNGFQLYCDPVDENQVFVSVNLPSKCLQSVGVNALVAGWTWLCESGLRFNVTRCDAAFDTQGFSVQQFADAYFEGLVKTNSRSWEEKRNGDGGHTFYVGSRESLRMLRVYHKMDGCSFGSEHFTRVELELKSVCANLFMLELMAACPSEWAVLATAHLNGFLELPLPWWNDFLVTAKSAWLKLRKKVSTVASMGRWLRVQVAVTLATYVQAVCQGEVSVLVDEINSLLKDGQSRFKRRHEQLIMGNHGDGMPEFAVYSFG